MNIERRNISPAVYSLLERSQPVFASVERSFPFFNAAKTLCRRQKI